MSNLWIGVVALALMNFTFKAIGPVLLARRKVPAKMTCVINAAGQCLLVSLVVVAIIGQEGADLDKTVLAGLASGVVLRLMKQHDLVCVVGAMVTVALMRALM